MYWALSDTFDVPESAQRPRSSGSPLLPLLPHTRRSPTSTTLKENNVTTISPSAPGRIMGPPSVKGAVTTSNTHSKKRKYETSHSPNPSSTVHRLLSNRFEVSVLTKGGRRSQIQTTSPTIPQTPLHSRRLRYRIFSHTPSGKRGSRCGFSLRGA